MWIAYNIGITASATSTHTPMNLAIAIRTLGAKMSSKMLIMIVEITITMSIAERLLFFAFIACLLVVRIV